MSEVETRIAGYFRRHEPARAKLGKALRTRLRARLPGLSEIVYVYEKQGALVFSYSPTERGADGVCALGLYPDRVCLFFTHGARLSKADPARLLQGRGKTVRHVVMGSIADFERPEIEVLIAAASTLARVHPVPGTRGEVILKADEQAQRARRATNSKRKLAPRRARKTPR